MGTGEEEGLEASKYDALVEKVSQRIGELKRISQLATSVKEGMKDVDSQTRWAIEILGELSDELTLEVGYGYHRKLKLGLVCAVCQPGCGHFVTVNRPGVDLYGQKSGGNPSHTFPCNHCGQTVAGSRYTSHLEKCMGMGRSSSRLARRRIIPHIDSESDDIDYDEDDGLYSDSNRRKRQKGASPKKYKQTKLRPDSANPTRLSVPKTTTSKRGTPTSDDIKIYSEMELREHFTQYCWVLSANTGKPCTKSPKCPLHDDNARRKIREEYNIALPLHPSRPHSKLGRRPKAKGKAPIGEYEKGYKDSASLLTHDFPGSLLEIPISPNEYVDVDGEGDDTSDYR